jgi:hypothetical protein
MIINLKELNKVSIKSWNGYLRKEKAISEQIRSLEEKKKLSLYI